MTNGSDHMSVENSFKIDVNVDKVTEKLNEALAVAFEMVGLQMESYAKLKCPVDTGLLRNSIAHATSGETPSIGASYKGTKKKARTYHSNLTHADTDVTRKAGTAGMPVEPLTKGSYSKNTPKEKTTIRAYVGTNVYYAPYVEMGVINPERHTYIRARPYIKPAVENHLDEYKTIIERVLQEEMN